MTAIFSFKIQIGFLGPKRAGKDRDHLNKGHQTPKPDKAALLFPPYRVIERKIGKATFTVYSWFNRGKEKDAVSTLARLMQHDNDKHD
ncbi:MAG: hypothetical protein LBV27_06715 [Oscillospiraceae bacterium]|jgi:hypothetical protein|nr:hypothetical protein [Oscillospiraceae bacterium]